MAQGRYFCVVRPYHPCSTLNFRHATSGIPRSCCVAWALRLRHRILWSPAIATPSTGLREATQAGREQATKPCWYQARSDRANAYCVALPWNTASLDLKRLWLEGAARAQPWILGPEHFCARAGDGVVRALATRTSPCPLLPAHVLMLQHWVSWTSVPSCSSFQATRRLTPSLWRCVHTCLAIVLHQFCHLWSPQQRQL